MSEARTVVIGLGNPLMGDDGVGIAALDVLQEDWQFEPPVEYVDGGTWGMNLLPVIESAHRLLFIDALDVGADPGTLAELARDQLPKYLSTKISPHQIDLREVLAVAEWRGSLPRETVVIGLQVHTVAMTTALTPIVAARLPSLVTRVIDRLESWGHGVLTHSCTS